MSNKRDKNNLYNPGVIGEKFSSGASSDAKAIEDKKAMAGKHVYDPNTIESKWQEIWEENKTFSSNIERASDPYYNLMMFPYPSAEGLHVGNMYAFTGADIYARFNRMNGKDVLEPIGLDGFGIHSENYAIKVGRHPKDQAKLAEKNFYRQLRSIGNSFDWQRTIETYDPDYYKWTQWIFIQLFKSGLAYRKKAQVNWCPKDLTVLSDEQVEGGKCERCGSEVEKKDLEQWFFRITKYAQRLLDNIDKLKWSEKVKIAQRNWIGKSEGAEIDFEVEGLNEKINVFTTRPDTLFGATFMVIAPEHDLSAQICQGMFESAKINEVKEYVEKTKDKSEIERTAEGKEKTGVITGLFAINPINSKRIPILISDYVLSGYGTGAIMAVPAHDQRDFETAKKFGFEIIPVIKGKNENQDVSTWNKAYIGEGEIIGSDEWNGFQVPRDIPKIIDWLENKKIGKRKVNYHLRDWLISRQRYWGPPIPLVFCENCADKIKNQKSKIKSDEFNKGEIENPGWIAVKEADLPILLPDVEDWKPMGTGKAPLANHPEFYKTTCPNCGGEAMRETDVSDTFLDSAWYFLRYPSTNIKDKAFDPEITKKWLPVNQYIGGAEHAVLHLLYSRFITMSLHDIGLLNFEEPFSKFFAHGLIIKDGAKMSKSKGNVVVPDEYIKKYGADSLRSYLMFLGPYSDGGDFRDSGIEGMNRFIKKVWRLFSQAQMIKDKLEISNKIPIEQIQKIEMKMNLTIKDVTEDISEFKYNTAIAKLMEFYNVLNAHFAQFNSLDPKYIRNFLLLFAPFAPHMTEELWSRFKINDLRFENEADHKSKIINYKTIHLEEWPTFDSAKVQDDTLIVVVQINGKKRGELTIDSKDANNQEKVENLARSDAKKYLEGHNITKTIYITGRIINFVI